MQIKFTYRYNRLIMIGDSHNVQRVKEHLLQMPDGSDVVHVGDTSIGYGDIRWAKDNAKVWMEMYNEVCVKKDLTFYIIRGNHEPPWAWDLPNLSNVFMIHTGDVGVFPNGKTNLFICGGISVDRVKRVVGETYWPDEITETLEHVSVCDFAFMHDAPEHFNHPTATLPNSFGWYVDRDPTLMDDSRKQRANMTKICKESGAKVLIGGHFHNFDQQEIDGVKYRCLNIDEVWEFDSEKYDDK